MMIKTNLLRYNHPNDHSTEFEIIYNIFHSSIPIGWLHIEPHNDDIEIGLNIVDNNKNQKVYIKIDKDCNITVKKELE